MLVHSRSLVAFLFFLAALTPGAQATPLGVSSPTGDWTVVSFGNLMDVLDDQQTGHSEGDIVGNTGQPGFYTASDGVNIYYRVRLGETSFKHGAPEFERVFWVGVDANSDGALDLFMAVNNQGNNTSLEFRAAGSGLNNSPSTTSVGGALPQYTIQQNAANFHYAPVSGSLQPDIENLDLDGDGKTDAFLGFSVPLYGAPGTASLQRALAGLAGISISEDSPLAYVIATSTQTNALNQDLGAVDDNHYNPTWTWHELGALSSYVGLDGSEIIAPTAVPEPGTGSLLSGGIGILLILIGCRARLSFYARLRKTLFGH